MSIEKPKRRPGGWLARLRAFVVLLLIVTACGTIYHFVLRPLFETGFGYMITLDPPGSDPSAYDPIASYDEVMRYAAEGGDPVNLVRIEAYYVRSDGTMELTANYSPSPRVEYRFEREVAPPPDAPPLGVGSSSDNRWFETITVRLRKPGNWYTTTRIGGGVSTEFTWMDRGMSKDISSPSRSSSVAVPAPRCMFSQLWAEALRREAPRAAVATISYDQNGYSFRISGTGISLEFTPECALKP